jgi:hypothetical protein
LSLTQFILFELLRIITFIHFSYILSFVYPMDLIFGVEKNWNSENLPVKFSQNPVCILWESGLKILMLLLQHMLLLSCSILLFIS